MTNLRHYNRVGEQDAGPRARADCRRSGFRLGQEQVRHPSGFTGRRRAAARHRGGVRLGAVPLTFSSQLQDSTPARTDRPADAVSTNPRAGTLTSIAGQTLTRALVSNGKWATTCGGSRPAVWRPGRRRPAGPVPSNPPITHCPTAPATAVGVLLRPLAAIGGLYRQHRGEAPVDSMLGYVVPVIASPAGQHLSLPYAVW